MTPTSLQSRQWRVEEACANAYPCGRELRLEGWTLKAAGGHTRRNNSVNPLHPGAGDISGLVAAAEAAYRQVGQPTLFRIPDMTGQADAALDWLGYSAEGETVTLLGSPAPVNDADQADTSVILEPRATWFQSWRELRPDIDTATAEAHRHALQILLLPAAFGCVRIEGRPVSVAFAAVDRGVAVVESVVTHAAHRERGYARGVLRALLNWSIVDAGAEAVCVQVQADNAPARALYRSFGLTDELYRYRYRRAPCTG